VIWLLEAGCGAVAGLLVLALLVVAGCVVRFLWETLGDYSDAVAAREKAQ